MRFNFTVIEHDGKTSEQELTKEEYMHLKKALATISKQSKTKTDKKLNTKQRIKRYRERLNIALGLLIESGINKMPIDVEQIADAYNVIILNYKKDEQLIKIIDKENKRNKSDGFCSKLENYDVVCVNDNITAQRRRWTIAHEIGHIALQHRKYKPEYFEKEANELAQNILCPQIIAILCRIHTYQELAQLCDVSISAAEIAMEKLNYRLIDNEEYLNALEKTLAQNMAQFCNEYIASHEEKFYMDYLKNPTIKELWTRKLFADTLTAFEITELSCKILNIEVQNPQENKVIEFEAFEIFKETRNVWRVKQGLPEETEEFGEDVCAYGSAMLNYFFDQRPFLKGVPHERAIAIYNRAKKIEEELLKKEAPKPINAD